MEVILPPQRTRQQTRRTRRTRRRACPSDRRIRLTGPGGALRARPPRAVWFSDYEFEAFVVAWAGGAVFQAVGAFGTAFVTLFVW